ncbi:MAG: helix-turn-helix domain-containing protein [Pseudomonadota bacterium]
MSKANAAATVSHLSPGDMLRRAREAQELSQREVADRLHLMPGYPAIIERDEFDTLRHPAFARGYVKAYGKLVNVNEEQLLHAFDSLQSKSAKPELHKIRTTPLQLQHTGVGVVVGLVLLALLVAAIWWWRGSTPEEFATAAYSALYLERSHELLPTLSRAGAP